MADVLIVGAGPSGLFMAAEAIRQGLTCRIIDKSATPSQNSKAIAVQARSLEVLTSIGVIDSCLKEGLKIHQFSPVSNHKILGTISLDLVESPFPFVLSLEQSKLEAILIKHLETLGCRVERQVELLDYAQDEDKVTVTLQNMAFKKIESYETKWLVGADGAHSTVRKRMNLGFDGFSFPQIFSLADIELEWKYPKNSGMAFLNKAGLFVVIPFCEKNRVRVIFQLERGGELLKKNQHLDHGEISSDILKKPTLEEITQMIHQYADSQAIIKNPIWMANFSINSRMVSRYMDKQVFLIGDAAHIHSPVGGQGMNTGLQDGFNLGWKLALVQKGKAKRSLLESYHDERHEVGKKLLNGTERATNFILIRSPLLFFLRNWFLSFVTSFTYFQKKMVATISEVNISYPMSAWVYQKNSPNLKLKAGMRAPDAPCEYLGTKSSLFNLWKSDIHFKLLFIGQIAEPQNSEISNLSKKYADLITTYFIEKDFDMSGEIKKIYGDSTLYLIRPDGYIGFCGPIGSLDYLTQYLNNLLP